ncbi:MAG TPA: Spy/CpxP family protein refolding chaperone [Rhodocyclaceae bacterium]|nr:Spy/CpxP family protein refolding chaperone [Rhodocyclaceae bacterium]
MTATFTGSRLAATVLATVVLGGASAAVAQMGSGMMQRERAAMMPQAEQAAGTGGMWGGGPGMMHGGSWGFGPGMMHGGPGAGMMHYGAGMMHYGAGMMGPQAGMMMGQGMGMMGPLMLPDLSTEQRTEMRTLMRGTRRAHIEKMLEIMDTQDEMADAMAADQPDPQAVRELHERMAKLQGDMLQSRIEARNRMFELLTDEQRDRMRELRGRFGRWDTD